MGDYIYIVVTLAVIAFITASIKLGVFRSRGRIKSIDKDIDKLNNLLTSCLDNNLHGLKVSVVTEDGRIVVIKDFN